MSLQIIDKKNHVLKNTTREGQDIKLAVIRK